MAGQGALYASKASGWGHGILAGCHFNMERHFVALGPFFWGLGTNFSDNRAELSDNYYTFGLSLGIHDFKYG